MEVRTNNLVQFDWRGEDEGGITGTVCLEESTQYNLNDVDILHVLEHAMTARSMEELHQFTVSNLDTDDEGAEELLDMLVETGFLLPTDHENFDKYSNWLEKGWARALFYHMKTRQAGVKDQPAADGGAETQRSEREGPSVTPYTSFSGEELVDLPEPGELPEESFWDVAHRRRTHRNFNEVEIDQKTLSTLLHYSFHPVREARNHVENTPLLDVDPEALQRISFEVYAVVLRCEGIVPGIYQYSIQDHALSPIQELDDAEEADELVVDAGHEQSHPAGSSVTFFFSSHFEREQQWYRESRGIRNNYMRISEHAHRLILVATALELRNYLSPALKDSFVDEVVGVDGYDEAVSYLTAVGN